jgi:hypothetical protein
VRLEVYRTSRTHRRPIAMRSTVNPSVSGIAWLRWAVILWRARKP